MTTSHLKRTNRNGWTNLFDELFNTGLETFVGGDFSNNIPAVNVISNKDGYQLELAVPGLTKEDINIDLDKQVLTISASKEQQENEEKPKFTRREFNYNTFKRSFKLPKTINIELIKADFENGVLSIELPKKEEAKEVPARSIEIG